MNGRLTKYEVKPSKLTLTIQLDTGSEVIVSIPCNVVECLAGDFYEATYPHGPGPDVARIIRTIASDGSMPGNEEDEVEYEKEEDSDE